MSLIGIDFFCGIGGTTKGFQNSGIKIIKGIDNDETCKETYEKNCYPSKFILSDLNNLDPVDLMNSFVKTKSDHLIFSACAPCQPFSRSYKKKLGLDKRKNLILRFLDFVETIVPDVIFIENVPGFEKAENGNIKKELLERLMSKDLEYNVKWNLIDVKTYGLPQTRRRFVLLASKLGRINFPSPTHGKGLSPYSIVRDAISEYPAICAGQTHKVIPNHSARNLSNLNMERMQNTPKNGGGRKDWPKELWLECHKKNGSGHSDVYGRLSWDKPANTLTCKCNSITNGRFGHPIQDRAISLREAASIQSFPDDFIFYGSNTNIAKHIGNAVPPLLGEIIGKIICDHIQKFGCYQS